jgi:hypothetical protein
MSRKQRTPEDIIQLYDWLWKRATKDQQPPFVKLQPNTLTGRCILLLSLRRVAIRDAMKSRAYRNALAKFVHSN